MSNYSRRQALKLGTVAGVSSALLSGCDKSNETAQSSSPAMQASKSGPTLGNNVDHHDATWLAEQIRSGALKATEAVNQAIARAEQINPRINAIVTPTFEAAKEQASSLENAPQGAFSGVPFFIKDLMNVTGVPTQFGSRAYADFIPDHQFPFIDDLEATGLTSLGRSSTPEFGLTATTEPLSSGPTRNPWNTDHSSGGSSGGAAALVASGVVPMAHASDGGGSIRIPASCCGLVGLKVSRDRFAPVRDEKTTPVRISVMGVVSRTVRDTANFIDAMELKGDRAILDPVTKISGPATQRLKIGAFTDTPSGVSVDADIVETIEKTAKTCSDLGHTVEAIKCPITDEIADAFFLYWSAFAASAIADWEKAAGRKADESVFEPFTIGLRDHFQANTDKMRSALIGLIGFATTFRNAFGDYDVLLSPVLTTPPPPIGYLDTTMDLDIARTRLLDYAQFTAPANIAGTPALSLPMGMSRTGLPIGAQFHAREAREDQLLALAFELEQAAPWYDRTPPVFAQ